MRPFVCIRANDRAAVAQSFAASGRQGPPTSAQAQFIAGGTTMLDPMKRDFMQPAAWIDINGVKDLEGVEQIIEGVRLGALARMADVANHALVRREYPVIADSLVLAASAQLRNMATRGGNVLRRTRCPYFRDTSWTARNKRAPGAGCAAHDGFNRSHAVLGASSHCIASYPGDFAQALTALDAAVETRRAGERRRVPFAALHRLPGDRPDVETTLAPDEMILAFILPRADWTRRSRWTCSLVGPCGRPGLPSAASRRRPGWRTTRRRFSPDGPSQSRPRGAPRRRHSRARNRVSTTPSRSRSDAGLWLALS
jgi:xanthine dehydrogenase YagS FAD-binding subunit